ncbi:hypothetical protein [Jannaschia pohangensis]|uniref:Uncharacterized protein n=1 Tax=Jannaschia pohangensis TaxID=390807 RepID=A0A1I3SF54_9RHOB|nr:hypothetical protein [Jannaschia pohangensis]SFJ57365.1 hypothetical protein SAMN04488095_3133 [Jannaschia pohangensis]
MIRPIFLVLFCAACGADLPPIEGTISDRARSQPFPTLVPLDPILAETARPSRAALAEAELRGRATRLTRQSIGRPITGDLAERGRRLRDRAARLRAIQI